MRKAIIIISVAFCLLLGNNLYCRADHITIAADNWCPINCKPSDSEPGIMIEIAQKVFTDAGHSLRYIILPWARAIKSCRSGSINGVIGAFIGDAPDFIFPDNELLMISSSSLFIKKESSWIFSDIKSLEDISLGAIIDYDYGTKLNRYIKKGKNIQLVGGDNPLEQNIKKLLIGRVDVVIETEPVFWYTVAKLQVKDKFKKAGQISEAEKCYIAFSPAVRKSKKYAKILSDGVQKLRNTGELKVILHKYGLTE